MTKFDTKMNRYPFVPIPERPVYEWPNGKRLAVYFAINIEAFEFGRNPGPDFTTMPSAPFHRGYAYRDYGNRVGAWRLLDMFNDLNIPLSVLTNAAVYDAYPELLAAFRERKDEFVGHGRTNSERQVDMTEDQEREMLREVCNKFVREEGAAPRGWLGPFISQSERTPELLVENGFRYMLDWFFDEQPQLFRTDNGPILSVLVYCVALHTFVMGQPHRARRLRRALEHVAKHRDDVWITTAGEIAMHALTLPKGILIEP